MDPKFWGPDIWRLIHSTSSYSVSTHNSECPYPPTGSSNYSKVNTGNVLEKVVEMLPEAKSLDGKTPLGECKGYIVLSPPEMKGYRICRNSIYVKGHKKCESCREECEFFPYAKFEYIEYDPSIPIKKIFWADGKITDIPTSKK